MEEGRETADGSAGKGRDERRSPGGTWRQLWRFLAFFYGLPVFKAARAVRRSSSRMSGMVESLWDRPAGRQAELGNLGSRRGMACVVAALAMVAVSALLLDSAARAQVFDKDVFDTVDEAGRELFGFLTGGDGDAQYEALGMMIWIFNVGVFVLAGVLLVYHAVWGVVETGRKGIWGFGGWELVRIVTAIALMAPIPYGPSPGQHIVLLLAGQGGDFAQAVWEPFSTKLLGSSKVVAPKGEDGVRRLFIAKLMTVEVCQAFAGKGGRISTHDQHGTEIWRYRLARGSGGYSKHSHCGEVRIRGMGLDGQRGKVADAHRDGADAARLILRRAAKVMVKSYDFDDPATYGTAVDEKAVKDAIESALVVYSRAVDVVVEAAGAEWHRDVVRSFADTEAEEASWTQAGSVFSSMAMRIGEFNWSVVSVPEVAGPMLALKDRSNRAMLVVMRANEDIARIAGTPISAIGTVSPDAEAVGGGVSGVLAEIFGALFFSFEDVLDVGEDNPLMDLSAIGHNLLTYSMIAVSGLMGVAVASNLGDTSVFGWKLPLDLFEAVYPVVDGLVTMFLTVMVMAGAILAYVVPALPFVRFLFGVLGWVMEVVEGVVAMTVWLAAHLTRTEGDGLTTSATADGFRRLAGIVLRPPLMVIGLVVGYFVFQVLVGLLNHIWMPYMKSSTGDVGPGLLGFAALLVIYVMIAWGLLNASMRLIEAVPDAVLEWIGARARNWAGADQVMGNMSGGAGRLSGFGPRTGGGRRGGGGQVT